MLKYYRFDQRKPKRTRGLLRTLMELPDTVSFPPSHIKTSLHSSRNPLTAISLCNILASKIILCQVTYQRGSGVLHTCTQYLWTQTDVRNKTTLCGNRTAITYIKVWKAILLYVHNIPWVHVIYIYPCCKQDCVAWWVWLHISTFLHSYTILYSKYRDCKKIDLEFCRKFHCEVPWTQANYAF